MKKRTVFFIRVHLCSICGEFRFPLQCRAFTRNRMNRLIALLLLASGTIAAAEDIKVATYNIEQWATNFQGHHMQMATRKANEPVSEQMSEVITTERFQNDEDNWEIAQVIQHKDFDPDVLVVQEGCGQSDLSFFNKRWLNNGYATVVQFPSNTDREQHLCILLKSGFKILQRRDKYHEERDAVGNERGSRLFARGPVFCLVQSPSGYKFWVGVTHQKSKRDNDVANTEWRNREAKRTHAIMKELEREGPNDVILLGDMNDEYGLQEFEPQGGGDTIANLVGPPQDGFVLATKKLHDAKEFSFGGYWRTDHRTLIDHVIVSKGMTSQLGEVKVVKTPPLAPVASDHYPVMVTVKAE
jgi:endonuclease/exonuclease/phosphatase family metal-dependent hydrolase